MAKSWKAYEDRIDRSFTQRNPEIEISLVKIYPKIREIPLFKITLAFG